MESQRVRHDWAILTSFHGWGNWGSGRISRWLKVIQVVTELRWPSLTSDFLSVMILYISVHVCSVMSHSFHDPMDCSLPGSSVHGILPAKILEGVAISSSRGSSWPKHPTRSSCIGSGFFTTQPHGKPCYTSKQNVNLTVNLEKNDID